MSPTHRLIQRPLAGFSCALGAAILAAGVSSRAASAQPTVTLAERDFTPGSVNVAHSGWGIVGSAAIIPRNPGGNPGGWLEVQINVAGGDPGPFFTVGSTTVGLVTLAGRLIDPAALGGILTIDASVDSRFVSATVGGCNCSGQLLILVQNGLIYTRATPNTTVPWTTVTASGLRASDFQLALFQDPVYFDPAQNPDFSPTGAPIAVGVARANSNGPAPSFTAYSAVTGMDNLIFTATGCVAVGNQPAPSRTCPTGSAQFTVAPIGLGPFTFQWQIQDATAPSGWADLADGPVLIGAAPTCAAAAGTQTAALSLTLACNGASAPALQGRHVRCLISATCETLAGAVLSAVAALTICAADFNCDGAADPDDLSDFITCFFTQPCAGSDFNGDGNTDPDDLSDYITAFFTGC